LDSVNQIAVYGRNFLLNPKIASKLACLADRL